MSRNSILYILFTMATVSLISIFSVLQPAAGVQRIWPECQCKSKQAENKTQWHSKNYFILMYQNSVGERKAFVNLLVDFSSKSSGSLQLLYFRDYQTVHPVQEASSASIFYLGQDWNRIQGHISVDSVNLNV